MVDAQIVYVDDSGTDGKSRIAAAAFCVSTVDRWSAFERRWRNISVNAGFKHFHMTEFAACKQEKPEGRTTRGAEQWLAAITTASDEM